MEPIIPTKSLLDQLECFDLKQTSHDDKSDFRVYANPGVSSFGMCRLWAGQIWACYSVAHQKDFDEYWEVAEWLESLDKDPE